MTSLGPRFFSILLVSSLAFVFAETGFARTCDQVHSAQLKFQALQSSESLLRNFPASESRSQKFRDNSPHYWAYFRERLSELPSSLQLTGIVHGDAHAGNFIVGPVEGKMKYYAFDIKDGGYGSFILDLNRLIVNSGAVLRDNKFPNEYVSKLSQSIFDSYLQGLRQQTLPTPEYMQKALNYPVEKYERKLIKDGLDDVKEKKEKFKNKETLKPLEPGNPKIQFVEKSLKQSFPQYELKDVALKLKERGGSKDQERLWALVKSKEGILEVIEFKEIEQPATAQFQNQPNPEARYELIFQKLLGYRNSELALAKDEQGTYYMVRKRKYEIFSFPYKLKTPEDFQLFHQMLFYTANFLGRLHGAQMTPSQIQTIENQTIHILNDLNRMNDDYLKIMNDLRHPEEM